MKLHNIAMWLVVISAASVGGEALFGYDFLASVFSSERVLDVVYTVVGLSGLYLLAGMVGLIDDEK